MFMHETVRSTYTAPTLPSPEELAQKGETVKITLHLSKSSVDFFKAQAGKHNTKYQKLIRSLLDEYTARQTTSS